MTEVEGLQPPPRRSQREKKTVTPFISASSPLNKRKRDQSGAEVESHDQTDADESQSADGDVDEEEEYTAPKMKSKADPSSKRSKKQAKKLPRKPRTLKVTAPKTHKETSRRPRKGKTTDDTFDVGKIATETKIKNDNPIFNAILNPSAALQSTAEDFLESLAQSPGPAQAELMNCILRSCGCNDSLNGDEVLDYDGVLDALDNFTEGLKQDNSPVYPLTSKLPSFKRFRKSLSEFIERLILSAAELGSLYTTDLMTTLQTWVVTMSSSQIRSFRHTATVIALEVETALCDVAASVNKEAEVVGRQKEGEKKRKATNKSAGAREKELEGKAKEIRERRTALAGFITEFVNSVFIHRYRDLDPHIRAECVKALGLWFQKYPGHFLDNSYLCYVGWVLSDTSTIVRLEAVKALLGVYQQVDYIGALNVFTERFKARLIEIANGDIDLSVRVAVIQVLRAINEQSLLQDEEREKLCLLLFDEEHRVRRAVSGFVRGIWEDLVEERLVGRKPTDKEQEWAGIKALGMLLVKWGKTLDEAVGDGGEDSDDPREGGSQERKGKIHEAVAVVSGAKSRVALAVEALWDEIPAVNDWEGLLEVLLLDHSAAGEELMQARGRRRANASTRKDDAAVDSAWRLEEVEESVLLEVLVAALRKAKADALSSKKSGEDTVVSDITRALIKGLPRLFIKYQTVPNRIADVLLLPLLMNLDLYLEMRMITAYASLWDDVTKQFLSHSSMAVLNHAVACIRYFMDATSLSNTNSTKILELEDELSSSLRDAVGGRDEIEIASFSEDEVRTLGVICSRLAVLAGARDMTNWIEENEGGKQSSAWDIVNALVERGRMGYKEEEHLVDQALNLLNLHIIWKTRGLTTAAEPTAEEIQYRNTLKEQRNALVERLIEYAVGTQSNTADGVKRSAFQVLLNLHVLFCPTQAVAADGSPLPTASLILTLDDETQYRCASYVQAEIERYAEEIVAEPDSGRDEDASESDDDEHGKARSKEPKGKVSKDAKTAHALSSVAYDKATSRARLEQEYLFMGVVTTFLRALRAGAIDVKHCVVLLAQYGRLGPAFDGCSKVIVDILREEAMFNHHEDMVITIITQAVRESFALVLDRVVRDESHAVALSKTLSACFVLKGPQLSVIHRLDREYIIQIHKTLLSWLGKRIAAYEANANKKGRKTAILFFRVLKPLLGLIKSREALIIKAHLDQVLAQNKLEISPTSRIWDPERAYEKKLSSIMKDKAAGTKGRRNRGAKTDATQSSGEDESGPEGSTGDEGTLPSAAPPRRSARIAKSDGSRTDTEDTAPSATEEDRAPASRPRPRAAYKPKSPGKRNVTSAESLTSPDRLNGVASPRKRGRSPEPSANDERVPVEADSPLASPSKIQIRKRVRH